MRQIDNFKNFNRNKTPVRPVLDKNDKLIGLLTAGYEYFNLNLMCNDIYPFGKIVDRIKILEYRSSEDYYSKNSKIPYNMWLLYSYRDRFCVCLKTSDNHFISQALFVEGYGPFGPSPSKTEDMSHMIIPKKYASSPVKGI